MLVADTTPTRTTALPYDREIEDVGNVIAFEHVNLTVPDQEFAALFYVTGLGGTRDPYVDFGTRNMWVNFGDQQFHLPKGRPQRWRGELGLVVPSLAQLEERLALIARPMKDTEFGWERQPDRVVVRCPWGNRFTCHEPGAVPGMSLGIAWADTQVAPGSAAPIARFYRRVLGAPARVEDGLAEIAMGCCQRLRFRETTGAIAPYDGHHIAIYVSGFSAPHAWLAARGLVSEESDQHQYRFQALVDPDSGALAAELEHEVRSLHHAMYNRHLVNRNSAQGFGNFRRGREAFVP